MRYNTKQRYADYDNIDDQITRASQYASKYLNNGLAQTDFETLTKDNPFLLWAISEYLDLQKNPVPRVSEFVALCARQGRGQSRNGSEGYLAGSIESAIDRENRRRRSDQESWRIKGLQFVKTDRQGNVVKETTEVNGRRCQDCVEVVPILECYRKSHEFRECQSFRKTKVG